MKDNLYLYGIKNKKTMEKIHTLHGFKYFYSRRDKTWLIITPEGEELNGGDKQQTIFWINWKVEQK